MSTFGEYRGFQWRIEKYKRFTLKGYIIIEYIDGNICKHRKIRRDSKGYYIGSFFKRITKSRLRDIIDDIIGSYALDSDKYNRSETEFVNLL